MRHAGLQLVGEAGVVAVVQPAVDLDLGDTDPGAHERLPGAAAVEVVVAVDEAGDRLQVAAIVLAIGVEVVDLGLGAKAVAEVAAGGGADVPTGFALGVGRPVDLALEVGPGLAADIPVGVLRGSGRGGESRAREGGGGGGG